MSRRVNRRELDIIRKAHALVSSSERTMAAHGLNSIAIDSRRASMHIASELPEAETWSRRETDEIHVIARQALWDAAKNSPVSINWEK